MRRILLTIAASLAPASLSAQDAVDADVLMQDLRTLSADDMAGRATSTPGGERARAYIERRFNELGLEMRSSPFRIPLAGGRSGQGANVMAGIRGSERPDKIIVVSAHYDHVGAQAGRIYNGADDNASGVAALFAIAAALKQTPPRHSVLLVAFDAEELDHYGSRLFIQQPPVPAANMLLNVNLDMIGRSEGGDLWAVGPRLYPALRPAIAAAGEASPVDLRFGRDLPAPRSGRSADDLTQRSDHASFGAAGIPFVLFHTGEQGDYHQPSDDSDRIDPPFYRDIVATVLNSLRRLDADGAALDTARLRARPIR